MLSLQFQPFITSACAVACCCCFGSTYLHCPVEAFLLRSHVLRHVSGVHLPDLVAAGGGAHRSRSRRRRRPVVDRLIGLLPPLPTVTPPRVPVPSRSGPTNSCTPTAGAGRPQSLDLVLDVGQHAGLKGCTGKQQDHGVFGKTNTIPADVRRRPDKCEQKLEVKLGSPSRRTSASQALKAQSGVGLTQADARLVQTDLRASPRYLAKQNSTFSPSSRTIPPRPPSSGTPYSFRRPGLLRFRFAATASRMAPPPSGAPDRSRMVAELSARCCRRWPPGEVLKALERLPASRRQRCRDEVWLELLSDLKRREAERYSFICHSTFHMTTSAVGVRMRLGL